MTTSATQAVLGGFAASVKLATDTDFYDRVTHELGAREYITPGYSAASAKATEHRFVIIHIRD